MSEIDTDDFTPINFSKPLGRAATRRVVVTQAPSRVTETVTVRPAPVRSPGPQECGTTYLTKHPTSWNWVDLRSYVVTKVEQIHGRFPRETMKEQGIFSAFAGRYGELAGPIAVYAMETQTEAGFWMGSPISVSRFCRGSDKYFGDVIKQRLN